MRNVHQMVIHNVCHMIGGKPVTLHQDAILKSNVRELDVAVDEVVDVGNTIRNLLG